MHCWHRSSTTQQWFRDSIHIDTVNGAYRFALKLYSVQSFQLCDIIDMLCTILDLCNCRIFLCKCLRTLPPASSVYCCSCFRMSVQTTSLDVMHGSGSWCTTLSHSMLHQRKVQILLGMPERGEHVFETTLIHNCVGQS